MKVICSPDIHESVRKAIGNHPAVTKFFVIDYSDEQVEILHKDVEIIVAKKEYLGLKSLKHLKLFQVATAGYDQIDVKSLWCRNVAVCNNSGANANAVAELTIGAILSCLRNINFQHQGVTKNSWQCLKHTGEELASKTLGIIGLGRIGSKVAQLSSIFGCKILGHDINKEYRK